MPVESVKPLVALIAPLVGAALIVASRARPNLRETWSLLAAVTQCVTVFSMVAAVFAGDTLDSTLFSFMPEVALAFRVDALALLFAGTASALWVVSILYSIGYMRALGEQDQTRFYALFALALSATIGLAFSANLLTFYLFYEALTFITFGLVTHHKTAEALAAGRKYLAYHIGTSVAFLLPAIIWTYAASGTFTFERGGVLAGAGLSSTALIVLYFLFLGGVGKAAIMPLHAWLPAAMVAPVPVSALLHAVAVVNAGVFLAFRVILDVFGQDLMRELNLGAITLVVVSVTIVLASFHALRLDSLKAILAYSTIGQLSYMILGVALLSPRGMTGGAMHLAIHSISKITLFFCAGAIYVGTGRTNVSEMDGIGRRLPLVMAAFSVGALSIVGLPPMSGFWTKWYLLTGSLQARHIGVFVVLLLSTLLSAVYYLKVVRRAFFGSAEPGELERSAMAHVGSQAASANSERELARLRTPMDAGTREVPILVLIPTLAMAAAVIVLGIFPRPLLVLVARVFG